jgi:hypothetical protein
MVSRVQRQFEMTRLETWIKLAILVSLPRARFLARFVDSSDRILPQACLDLLWNRVLF